MLLDNIAECDLSNSVKNGILYLEDPVDKACTSLFDLLLLLLLLLLSLMMLLFCAPF